MKIKSHLGFPFSLIRSPWIRADIIAIFAVILSVAFPLAMRWWDARYVTSIDITRDIVMDLQRRGGDFDRVVFKVSCRNLGSAARQVSAIHLRFTSHDDRNHVLVFPVDPREGTIVAPLTTRLLTGGISLPEYNTLSQKQWKVVAFEIRFGDGGKDVVEAADIVFGRGNLIIPRLASVASTLESD